MADIANKLNYVPKKAFWIQAPAGFPFKKNFFYKPRLDYDLILLPQVKDKYTL